MTTAMELLGQAEGVLQHLAVEITNPEENRMDVLIHTDKLIDAVKALVDVRWGYFTALTGLDIPPLAGEPETEGFVEGLYHFCEGAAVVTLRVRVPYSDAVVDSLCGIIPSANLYEREFSELFGVTIRNAPNTMPLLLADDWPAGVYPLRKSFASLPVETKVEVKND
jgi:NADH:ubiquinone oxidoreductase subunit C